MTHAFYTRLAISVLLTFTGFACAVIFGVKMIPGGPFVSFRGDILPHIFAIAAFAVALRHYRSYPTIKRIISLCTAGFALLLSAATGLATYSFFYAPYARGAFFRW
jgi:hypothetical protein